MSIFVVLYHCNREIKLLKLKANYNKVLEQCLLLKIVIAR